MRINFKIYRVLLLAMVLITFVLSSTYALAQEEKRGLSLRLSPGRYDTEIRRGESNTLYIEVVNDGPEPLTDIRLYSDGLKGWVVEFEPPNLAFLAAESYQTVDVIIRAPENIEKGSYNITCIAEAGDMRAVLNVYLRVEQANPIWLRIGIVVAVLMVAGFIFVFIRMGKQ